MKKSPHRLALLALALGLTLARPAASSAQSLYAASFSNSIASYTSDGTATPFASTGLSGPFGLAFDPAGNLYAANRTGNTIEEFTPGGVASTFASTGLNAPVALAFDAAGNLYVANSGNNTIERFTPGGVGSVFTSAGLNTPYGLAFDAAGNLYASNRGGNTVSKITSGGVASTFATTGLRTPTGLAFNAAGTLFVANAGAASIYEYNASGQYAGGYINGLSSPYGLAFDPVGNLYAANLGNNTIEKIATDGTATQFASLTNPTALAFQVQVPEPSTWAAVAAGAGLLGFVTLRQRRRPVPTVPPTNTAVILLKTMLRSILHHASPRLRILPVAAVALAAFSHSARAAFTLTLQQVGANVVASGSGSINLSALTNPTALNAVDGINPSNAFFGLGTPASGTNYTGLTGPANFGTASYTPASSTTGNFIFLNGSNRSLAVPTGYVSNSLLTDSDTFNNATLASLGFTPGTYTYTWGSGATADSLTVTSVVPEPSTWALLGLGVVGLGVAALRRRRAVRTA